MSSHGKLWVSSTWRKVMIDRCLLVFKFCCRSSFNFFLLVATAFRGAPFRVHQSVACVILILIHMVHLYRPFMSAPSNAVKPIRSKISFITRFFQWFVMKHSLLRNHGNTVQLRSSWEKSFWVITWTNWVWGVRNSKLWILVSRSHRYSMDLHFQNNP